MKPQEHILSIPLTETRPPTAARTSFRHQTRNFQATKLNRSTPNHRKHPARVCAPAAGAALATGSNKKKERIECLEARETNFLTFWSRSSSRWDIDSGRKPRLSTPRREYRDFPRRVSLTYRSGNCSASRPMFFNVNVAPRAKRTNVER